MSSISINAANSLADSDAFFNNDLFSNKNEIADYIRFLMREKKLLPVDVYKKADISKQNWSNYISSKNSPNPVNARKLIIGLECSIEEAEYFLSLCGFQFVKNNKADDCLKCCLKNHIFNMIDVYIFLDKTLTKKVA